jgi:hypothetical protein
MVLGRYDRERWKQGWRQLCDAHTLEHNRRQIQKIEISEQGDGAFAVVDVDTLWRATPTAKTSTGKSARASRSIAGRAAHGK